MSIINEQLINHEKGKIYDSFGYFYSAFLSNVWHIESLMLYECCMKY